MKITPLCFASRGRNRHKGEIVTRRSGLCRLNGRGAEFEERAIERHDTHPKNGRSTSSNGTDTGDRGRQDDGRFCDGRSDD